MGKLTLDGMPNHPDISSKEASNALAYSYWFGTFVVRGSVAPRIMIDVLGFGFLATLIALAVQKLESDFNVKLSVPAIPFGAAGAVLGLLLVMRVNAGYSRWWEARVLWGGIVNQTRNMAIAGLAYGPSDTRWRSRFVRWIAVFPHVCRRSLRGERNLPELHRLVSDDSLAWIENAEHMPNAVSGEIAILLKEARSLGMDGFAFLKLEGHRAELIDHLGGCERIVSTPLARSTAIQVRQFIFLFLVTLPLGLMHDLQAASSEQAIPGVMVSQIWVVPIYAMLLAYPLLSLDRIGMELQNPFSTNRIDFLPLDSICTIVECNVLELLQEVENQRAQAPSPTDVKLPPDAAFSESHRDLSVDIS